MACRVSAMMAFGATLGVPAGAVVPDAIPLAIAGDVVMRRGRMAWRRRGRIGVAFELPA